MSGIVRLTNSQKEALSALPEGKQKLPYSELHKLILDVVNTLKLGKKFEELYDFLSKFVEIDDKNSCTGNVSPQFPISEISIIEDCITGEPFDVSFELLPVEQD